jgi:hypothetical protein
LEFFIERFFHVHEAAGDGKLMEFATDLVVVRQTHEREDGAAELDAKGARLFAN